jgi:phosphoribosylamine--glycine ligase
MKVLVVGSGGREHALGHALARSRQVRQILFAPGNPGTARLGENFPVDAADVPRLLTLARQQRVDLTIVGPEDPLCAGIVDAFQSAGLRIFGPCAAAARLEGDKAFAKQLMRQAAVPTAEARIFNNFDQAYDYVASRDAAVVIKAAGLAKGKGVMVCDDPADGLLALERVMVDLAFGEAGRTVLVEEKLLGKEVSVHALVDGRSIYVLETARDHKQLGDGDSGPNTGGMGAFSPVADLDDACLKLISEQVLVPVVDQLNKRRTPYVGVLYAGLMLTAGGPKVLEFNCRLGDPEAQVLLLRLRSDLVEAVQAVLDGRLDEAHLEWDPRPAVCVVMASRGYPERHSRGQVISGLDSLDDPDVTVFHAGTARRGDDLITSGGRVLGVTALGTDEHDARRRAYSAVDKIHFEGARWRRDIGQA